MAAMPSTSEWLSGPPSVRGTSKEKPKISMSRGLRDESARGIDARTDHDAFVNGALEPEHGTTQVAHCCETPHQRRLSLSRSQQMKVGGVGGHEERLGCRRHERMPMRVNKAWHQHAPVPRNDADIGICVDGDRVQGDSLNLVASNQHIGRSRERGSSYRRRCGHSEKALPL